ncbi:DUF885 domain-containing protein [Roseateles saccharophilus]|uniref:Uncharacterized protein (DUF885 family) n=1 Tax=Roseateles saccharophilus TaxID=304 RepID=A0A4V2VRI4_ROSSA|nr:DUF885 domain-containing protein [Roseateles saccharophilus]MDG0831458.1 DUF885 domain-containing protein [Roseateles saccharophilus]TCU98659.1 uncharacterized protein (DUF885 family) [Roseateles saccharophilus]
MLRSFCLALAPLLAVAPLAVAAPPTRVVQAWQAVLADYDQHLRAADPLRAVLLGDMGALARWPDESAPALQQRRLWLQRLQARLALLERAGLPAEDALSRDLLAERVELELQGLAFDVARLPYISGDGFYTLPNYAADGVVLRDEAQARAWLDKIAALPAFYKVQADNLRRGAATGFVRPRFIAEGAAAALRSRADQPAEAHALLKPLAELPASMPPLLRAQLQAEGLAHVQQAVKPAEREMAELFERVVVPAASSALGISALPGGADYYTYLIRQQASTRMSPEDIHALGLREVARIEAEMRQVMAGTGFTGSVAEFSAQLRDDPRFRAASLDDYVTRARDVAKRADALLPAYFRRLPQLSYGLRAVAPEMKASSSGYNPGSLKQGVAGTVLVGREAVTDNPLYGLTAWTLHEGVPGHHLQIALAQERDDLPAFRRIDDQNAYVEGWALYAEHLGVEMGLYRDAYEHFGRLSFEIWRACRLVVDTGLHAQGWTREQAVAYLREHTALGAGFIEAEVDRYIGWPAQALGYKLGELRIRALRERAERELGGRFDLREFHDVVLRGGPMPLDLLEREVGRWIETQRDKGRAQ